MRVNCKTCLLGGQNLTALSVYQVNPVSRINGEGRAEVLRRGPEFGQKGGGNGGRGGRGRVKQLNLYVETFNPPCGGGAGGRGAGAEGFTSQGCMGVLYAYCYVVKAMVRVVGNEGALAAGGDCSSGMNGSKRIMRRNPGRGSVYYFGGFRY